MAVFQSKTIYNQTFVKEYSNGIEKKWRFCTFKGMRNPCIQAEFRGSESERDSERESERESVSNDLKLDNNIIRTRSTIFELAYCNQWDWFFTGTLAPDKYDRTNLEKYHKDLTQWFRNYGKKYGIKIKFLLVPELHSDGKSWHVHGLLSGLPVEHLHKFVLGDIMGVKLADKVKRGDTVYNWLAYQDKFGFCDLESVRSHEAVSKYMTKYISKSLGSSVKALNAHLYYCSRGLNRAVAVKSGYMSEDLAPDFVNDYCAITWVDNEQIAQKYINSIL